MTLPALVAAVAVLVGLSPVRVRAVVSAATGAVEHAPAQAALVERVGGVRAEALMLAIAVRESHLRVGVERCRVVGDQGRAVGLWQEHATGKTRDALCALGASAQARVALDHLAYCAGRSSSLEGIVACYAGRAEGHPIVADRAHLARELAGAP